VGSSSSRVRATLGTALLFLSLVGAGMAVIGAGIAGASGSGSTYYVSTSGSDSNAGSIDAPWRTVTHGLSALKPGDTLYLRGGTYVERIKNPSISAGTVTSPITVAAYPGERPVIQGLLWMTGPSYWTFDGVNVTWDLATGVSSEHMVKMTNGVGWTFKDAELWGAHSYAAFLVYSSVAGEPVDWTIASNCIHDTWPTNDVNQDHLVYANSGLHANNGLIERNILFNATNGDGVKLGGSSSGANDTAGVVVRDNTIYNTSQNVRILWTSRDNEVYGNILDQVNLQISPNYGNVRGYQLSGSNDAAHDNWGYAAKTFIYNDQGYQGVSDAGNNQFGTDPLFDSTSSCAGFHPLNVLAQAYGRYAPGDPNPTPSPSPSETPTPTPSPSSTPSPTPTASSSPSPSPSTSGTPSPSPTPTETPTPTPTPTPSQTEGAGVWVRGSSATASSKGKSVSVAKPSGVVEGDAMVAAIAIPASPTVTAPIGWTLVRTDVIGTSMTLATYWHVAGLSEPTSYVWSLSSQRAATGAITAYVGANVTAPIFGWTSSTSCASPTILAPSVGDTPAGSMALGVFALAAKSAITAPSGFVERTSMVNGKLSFESSDASLPLGGDTGTQVATASKSACNAGQLLVIAPA
jgi:hypothetical protein